jgi:membrane-bound ClpP family serine protease
LVTVTKEEIMAVNRTGSVETVNNKETAEPKKKKSFWDVFITFISMGGLILIVVVLGAIAIGIGMLFQR